MINLGLARIAALVNPLKPLPWRAVHVAGTNGKGSVCGYITAMLVTAGLKCGTFTSPHLVTPRDSIAINGETISDVDFQTARFKVKERVRNLDIQATPFEVMTATAFEAFSRAKVDVGVVEVGVGGLLDATNILDHPLATVITKIGLDHQNLLGNTLVEIAKQKAGIMKPGVPCVITGENYQPDLKKVFNNYATEIQAGKLVYVHYGDPANILPPTMQQHLLPHQQLNMIVALKAARLAVNQYFVRPPTDLTLLHAARHVKTPGRMQRISLRRTTGRYRSVLLDGAHNASAAKVLGAYVDGYLRPRSKHERITWVIALSGGRNPHDITLPLLKAGDDVLTCRFSQPEEMDWVTAAAPRTLRDDIMRLHPRLNSCTAYTKDVRGLLNAASELAQGGPLVITGSLYLVSDVVRLATELQNGEAELIGGEDEI